MHQSVETIFDTLENLDGEIVSLSNRDDRLMITKDVKVSKVLKYFNVYPRGDLKTFFLHEEGVRGLVLRVQMKFFI